MESLILEINPEKFDEVVHGTLGEPSLPEGGDLAIYIKPGATVEGNAVAVITFTVQTPSGEMARAQCPTTVRNLLGALQILKTWENIGKLTTDHFCKGCGGKAAVEHECLYKAAANGDHVLCNCCESCALECAEDI